MHKFCQSEALPDRFLVQKVSLNVLYICDLINFSRWEMFSRFYMVTKHVEMKYTERNASLFGKEIILFPFSLALKSRMPNLA